MATPVEAHFGLKWLVSVKNALTRVFAYGKQIAILGARVTALEAKLEKHPPDTCQFCGELAMRKTSAGMIMRVAQNHWREDVWTCEKCAQKETRVVRF
jgi:ribosomal protein L37AE/L43A